MGGGASYRWGAGFVLPQEARTVRESPTSEIRDVVDSHLDLSLRTSLYLLSSFRGNADSRTGKSRHIPGLEPRIPGILRSPFRNPQRPGRSSPLVQELGVIGT